MMNAVNFIADRTILVIKSSFKLVPESPRN